MKRRAEIRCWAWFLIFLEATSCIYAMAERIRSVRVERNAFEPVPARKRSVDDLLSMNHPDFVHDDWIDTFRAHVAEIHARGHRLSVRQTTIDPAAIDSAFSGAAAKFDVDDEAGRLSQVLPATAVNYTQAPVNAKQILEGVITGVGGVFVPGLKDANNGTEAMATFQQCFDPRKLYESFAVKDFFKAQAELPAISDADVDAFQASIELIDGNMTASSWNPTLLLKRFEALNSRTWKTWKYLAAILKKLGPYVLQLLKHSYRCGVIDIVLGFALSFVLPLFPPILLVLIAVAAMAFELFTQIKAAVDNWYRDWFKFGKAIGAILAFVASLVIAYKMGKSGEIRCTGQKKAGCTYEMPKNEMNNWQPPKSTKYCAGKYCNPVYQRNDIIDPNLIDSRGRTNIERMKAGAAAIGPDGKPLNLHHILQDPDGPIAELTDTFHESNPKLLNLYLKPGEPSRIDRPAFDLWRSSYWRARGRSMEEAINAGTYLATFGQTVANYAPVAGVAITKAWNSTAVRAGEFLGKAIDAIADGDSSSLVTSVKAKLEKLDIVRLLLLALKGTAARQADDLDASMAGNTMPGGETVMSCSTDANCDVPVRLYAERFDRADGEVRNSVRKRYRVHFAPDTGFALSLSAIVNEGAARISVTPADNANGVALAESRISNGARLRATGKLATAGQLDGEFASAQHRVALQHCDGYGDYSIELKGARPPTPSSEWESESGNASVRAFWLANGAPPELDQSLFAIGAQYVPYPTVPSGVKQASDGLLVFAPAVNRSAVVYHVLLASTAAPPVATVCDVLRVGRVVMSIGHPDNAGSTLQASFDLPAEDSRAYVIAESDGGAMTLYAAESADGGMDMYSVRVTSTGGLTIIGVAVAVPVIIVVIVALAVVVALVRKKRRVARS
jgi:hypothetical protein